MLAAEKLDAVVASQPFDHHASLLPEIYPHVGHIFTEKPLAISPDVGQRLTQAAARAGCVHMVGYHKRSDPATMAARETIQQWKNSGEMGRLTYVRILMPPGDWVASGFTGLLDGAEEYPALETEPPCEGMDDKTYEEYVSFVNYYIHQVNLMRYLLDEPYEVTHAENSGVVMVIRSASGIPGVIEMSPYGTTVEWEESALIAFEKGYIKLRLPAPLATHRAGTVEIYTDDGRSPQRRLPTMPWVHAMRQQAAHFVKVCKGEMSPQCDAAEAAKDLTVARDYIRLRFGK